MLVPQLESSFADYLQTPNDHFAGRPIDQTATPSELGITFDLEATHRRGAGIGREGVFGATWERIVAHSRGYDVAPVVRVDEDAISERHCPVSPAGHEFTGKRHLLC